MPRARRARFLLAIAVTTGTLLPAPGAGAEDATTTTVVPDSNTVPPTTTTVVPRLSPSDIRLIKKIHTTKPVVFITIDDGSYVSPELAEVIDKNKVPVTTFAMPEMVWRAKKWYLARKNMTFENHTNTHAHMTTISRRKQTIELCWASRLIKRMVGTAPVMYRPPRGSWDEKNRVPMARCGLKYAVMWSVVVTNTGADHLTFSRGDIILMHYVPSLPQALQSVLDRLKDQGLRPALLRDYLPD